MVTYWNNINAIVVWVFNYLYHRQHAKCFADNVVTVIRQVDVDVCVFIFHLRAAQVYQIFKKNSPDKLMFNTTSELMHLNKARIWTKLLSKLFFAQSIWKFEFLFHEDSQYTGVWLYCGVYKTLRCLSKQQYKLRCLEYICSVFSPLILRCACALRPLNREDTDKCTLTITFKLLHVYMSVHLFHMLSFNG